MPIIQARGNRSYLVENNINFKVNTSGPTGTGAVLILLRRAGRRPTRRAFTKVKICIENTATFHAPNELPTIAARAMPHIPTTAASVKAWLEVRSIPSTTIISRPFERHDP